MCQYFDSLGISLPFGNTLRCKLFSSDKFYEIQLYFLGGIKYNGTSDKLEMRKSGLRYILGKNNMGKCTELILISRCYYGSVSPFVKMVQDRAISYIHADFVIRKGKMHHKRRYKNIITLSAHLYGENITDIEKGTARELLKANADNYDGRVKDVYFYKSVEELEGVIL